MQAPEPSSDAPDAAASESEELAAKAIWLRFHSSSAKKQRKAVEKAVSVRVWRGLIDAPEGFCQLSERTLRRCWNRVKEYERNPSLWTALLIDDRFGRPRAREYSSRVDNLFRADFLRPERPSASASYDRIKGIAAAENLQMPAMKTLTRRMRAEVTWQAIAFSRYGTKALEATYPAQERDRSVFRALEALNADGWRSDNLVQWPDGYIGRPGHPLMAGFIQWRDRGLAPRSLRKLRLDTAQFRRLGPRLRPSRDGLSG